MNEVIYGFAVEPHKSWLVTPATKENGVIRCHDLSGFMGSWDMKQGGIFIESVSGASLCDIALEQANVLARGLNNAYKS